MKVVFVDGVREELARVAELRDSGPAAERMRALSHAIGAVKTNPFIGQRTQFGLRELIVGEGRSHDVVLYEVRRPIVRVLAIRHQRERGYKRKVTRP